MSRRRSRWTGRTRHARRAAAECSGLRSRHRPVRRRAGVVLDHARRRRVAQRLDPVRRDASDDRRSDDDPTTGDPPIRPDRRCRRRGRHGRPHRTRPGCPRSAIRTPRSSKGCSTTGCATSIRSNDNPGGRVDDAARDRRRIGRRGPPTSRAWPTSSNTCCSTAPRSSRRTNSIATLRSFGASFGADVNAYTSYDETVYELTMPTQDADGGRDRDADPRTVADGGHARSGAGRGRAWRRARRVARVGDDVRVAGSSTSSRSLLLDGSPYEGRDPIGTDSRDQRDDPRAARALLRRLVPARQRDGRGGGRHRHRRRSRR